MMLKCPNCGGTSFAQAPSIDGKLRTFCIDCDNPIPMEPDRAGATAKRVVSETAEIEGDR